ncbi:MAG: glycosyltransferase [Candidatus Hydrogenedentes bacterium]|nr:glycosyltransferase [Candidatus Hydrogenedentota bacterium]
MANSETEPNKTLDNPFPIQAAANLRLLTLRFIALALLLAALTGRPVVCGFAIFALFVLWFTARASRYLLVRHFVGLQELRVDSNEGEGDEGLPGVTVIAPSRNEEAGVEEAVRSLAALDYPKLEIFAINDHSTDGTRAILERLAPEMPHVRIVHDPPVQEGWLGKANAIWYAVHQANPEHKWLLLADGDVVFHSKVVRRAVAYAEAEGYDFLTCVPPLDNRTFSEQLTLPMAWRGIIINARPGKINDPSVTPIGVGAFILVKRDVYLESGGHSRIRNQQPEDTLLAALIRDRGGNMGVAWTSHMLRVRLYRGYRDLVTVSVRKARVICDDNRTALFSAGVFVVLLYILPLPLAIAALGLMWASYGFLWMLSAFALAAFITYVEVALGSWASRPIASMAWYVPWVHPLGGLLRVWVHVRAMAQVTLKRQMDWRGRDFANVRANNAEQIAVKDD